MAEAAHEPCVTLTERIKSLIHQVVNKTGTEKGLINQLESYGETSCEEIIPFRLVKLLHDEVSTSGHTSQPKYLHEYLEGSSLHLPEFKDPPRSTELEARVVRLRAQQANRDYKKMVYNVDKGFQKTDKFAIGAEIKDLNRQLLYVINFLITVGGAFAFAYKATEYAFSGRGDKENVFVLQLMMGLVCGTVVFFADLYFLVRGM